MPPADPDTRELYERVGAWLIGGGGVAAGAALARSGPVVRWLRRVLSEEPPGAPSQDLGAVLRGEVDRIVAAIHGHTDALRDLTDKSNEVLREQARVLGHLEQLGHR